jgi:hypothetical protein
MYASVTTMRIPADQFDELVRLAELATPDARQLSGLQRGFLLTDRATDMVVAIGLWATEAEARAAGSSEREARMLDPLSRIVAPGTMERRVYEVARAVEFQ